MMEKCHAELEVFYLAPNQKLNHTALSGNRSQTRGVVSHTQDSSQSRTHLCIKHVTLEIPINIWQIPIRYLRLVGREYSLWRKCSKTHAFLRSFGSAEMCHYFERFEY